MTRVSTSKLSSYDECKVHNNFMCTVKVVYISSAFGWSSDDVERVTDQQGDVQCQMFVKNSLPTIVYRIRKKYRGLVIKNSSGFG